ncbi:protein ripply3 isoform X2 [Meriones unguiculatus]|uniref:protein ripply3 isoform X2 n=1 Tax=Meriones unguiculatus TaxID=10047 RepID=UPI00293E6D04|nr:protein ripply3 isoform X2 [Meriones unguiculatus]
MSDDKQMFLGLGTHLSCALSTLPGTCPAMQAPGTAIQSECEPWGTQQAVGSTGAFGFQHPVSLLPLSVPFSLPGFFPPHLSLFLPSLLRTLSVSPQVHPFLVVRPPPLLFRSRTVSYSFRPGSSEAQQLHSYPRWCTRGRERASTFQEGSGVHPSDESRSLRTRAQSPPAGALVLIVLTHFKASRIPAEFWRKSAGQLPSASHHSFLQ